MLTLNEIKELMDKMEQTNLGELKLKTGDFELKLEAKKAPQIISASSNSSLCAESAPISVSVSTSAPAEPAKQVIAGNMIKSPIVGTFYASAAPDKPPFVSVGSKVKKGDVLFVIESMKLMNEIPSEFDGEVVDIIVENAQGVEYNQPIMIIK